MEEVTKCSYIDCCPDSCSTDREQMLHELPVSDTGLCVKWLINSGHEDLINRDFFTLRSIKFFICNNHFSDDCYLSKGTLKETAVPFPYWHTTLVCSNTTRESREDCHGKEEQEKHEREEKDEQQQINGQAALLSTQHFLPLTRTEVVHRTNDLNDSSAVVSDSPQWCRTCATQRYNLISMTTKMKGTEMSLLSKLKLLIEIDDEDALPTKMCDECVAKLEQSFKFFQQIYVADNALRQLFSETQSAVVGRRGLSSPVNRRNEAARFEQHLASPLSDTSQMKNDNSFDLNAQLAAHGPGDLPGIELCASVRQTRQSRAADVPRSRRLVGRPRGSSSRWSRAARGSRVSRMSRASRGPRGTRGTRGMRSGSRSRATSSIPKAHHSDRGSSSTVDDRRTPDNEIPDPALSSQQTDEPSRYEHSRKRPRGGSVSTEDRMTREQPLETAEDILDVLSPPLPPQIVTEDSQGTSVFSLLTDGCRSDEELDWADVLAVMSRGGNHSELDRTEETLLHVPQLCCEFCDITFRQRSQLKEHLLTRHSCQSEHICIDCLICYKNNTELAQHRRSRHPEHTTYRCDTCSRPFFDKSAFKQHIAMDSCNIVSPPLSSLPSTSSPSQVPPQLPSKSSPTPVSQPLAASPSALPTLSSSLSPSIVPETVTTPVPVSAPAPLPLVPEEASSSLVPSLSLPTPVSSALSLPLLPPEQSQLATSSSSSLALSQVPSLSPPLLSLPPVPALPPSSPPSNSEFHHSRFTCDRCGKSVDSKALLATHIASADCSSPDKQISSDVEDISIKSTASNAGAPVTSSMLDDPSVASNSQTSRVLEQVTDEKRSIEGLLNTDQEIPTDSEMKFSNDVVDPPNVSGNDSCKNLSLQMDSSPIPVRGTTPETCSLSDKLDSGTSVTRRLSDDAMSDDGLDRTKRLRTSIGEG